MKLYSNTFGIGKHTLVFLPGWQQTRESFFPLVPFLSKQYRLILLDLPGFGQSDLPLSTWNSFDYAQAVTNWLIAQKLSSITLIGHSFGGKVATIIASKNPQLASHLILLNPAGLPEKHLTKFIASLIPTPLKVVFKPVTRRLFSSRDYQNAGILLSNFRRIVTEDLTKMFSSLKIPTLILWGNADTEIAPSVGQKISKLILNSQFVVIPGNHFFFLSNPNKTATEIINFLNAKHLSHQKTSLPAPT